MDNNVKIEVSVKLEPEDHGEMYEEHENTDTQEFTLKKEEEVWIKPELTEIDAESIKLEPQAYSEATNPQDCDTNTTNGDMKLKLPFKKRIDTKAKKLSADKCLAQKGEETGNNDKVAEKNQPTEDYSLMYSYEIIKNIQIVTIDEEERQIEHKEILSTRQHMHHVCENCALGFVVEDAFLMHMKIHSPESGDHECEICHSFLKSADMLYRHRLRHYRRYRCLICTTRFKDKDSAACHVMNDHERQTFSCTHCGRGFKRPQYLKRHVEQHHTKPHRLECPVCSKVFHERGWYRSHVRTHNEEVKTKTVKITVTCDVCARNFHTKAELRRHLATHAHHSACAHCGAQYPARTQLAQHYVDAHNMMYTGAVEVTCQQCFRVCATKEILRNHMRRMHTDRTKKYQCDHCQRLYLTKGEVRAHISWSHQPAHARRAHACSCGRQFRTPALLRDHRARLHDHQPPPRNHRCDHCGKAFGNKQVLNRHKKSHSNEMYPCLECGVLFKTQPYVKVHYQIKHLNMTRAQIKEQKKKNRIPQNNIHGRESAWEPSIPNRIKDGESNELLVDPLEVKDDDHLKVDTEDGNTQVPLYQTFVNVPSK